MDFTTLVDIAGKAIDGAGVVVIVVGARGATILLLRRGNDSLLAYRTYRQRLGRVILLGLEFLVAGNIICTVAIAPTFASVGVLGQIVIIRSFLSFAGTRDQRPVAVATGETTGRPGGPGI
jgi:uncharacterized membrane protein